MHKEISRNVTYISREESVGLQVIYRGNPDEIPMAELPGCSYFEYTGEMLYLPDGRSHFIMTEQDWKTVCYASEPVRMGRAGLHACVICVDAMWRCAGRDRTIADFMDRISHNCNQRGRTRTFLDNFVRSHLIEPVHPALAGMLESIHTAHGNLPVESIAAQVGYSARQMQTMFAREYGYGPKIYSQIIRLNCAVAQMRERPDRTLAQIAINAGYSDPSHFQRQFLKYMKMTPMAFRMAYMEPITDING